LPEIRYTSIVCNNLGGFLKPPRDYFFMKPPEITPTEYVYLTGFQRYLMGKLEEIDKKLELLLNQDKK
jgi:hypothetical protein